MKKNFITTILLLTILTFVSQTFSQSTDSGIGYLTFGQNVLEINNLNSVLSSKNYPTLSDKFFSFGAGGFGIAKNKLLLGGEGAALTGNSVESSNNLKLSLSGGYGFFNIGYFLVTNNKFNLYPLFGIGGGGIVLKITDLSPAINFDSVLNSPKRNVDITKGALLLKLAFGSELKLLSGNEEVDILLGFRLGYIFAPIKSSWTIENATLSGEPEIDFSGMFFNIHLGFGKLN